MAQRKLQQEVDKCFKKVSEGIQAFEGIFEKIQQASNASQKEKLEDALKREIKKLQRQRDQIKVWIASNEIKDKKPLLEQRKLIETQMEKFKAVEKEMKTKAYSKEGLSAAAKLDPEEKKKVEACQFLSSMVEDLERQVETAEAEAESLQATAKKGKKDTQKAERLAEIDERTERHKWHQGKLELILRALENGSLEIEQITALEESIRYYVDSNAEVDFMEDEGIYDELDLEEEEETFGMGTGEEHTLAQDAHSAHEDPGADGVLGKTKGAATSDTTHGLPRRLSTHGKSPHPILASLHNQPLATITNPSSSSASQMKPAPLPTRAPGETLKYASAAAAAASSSGDKPFIGIAPLPPPPPGLTQSPSVTSANLTPLATRKSSASASPKVPIASIQGTPQPIPSKAAAVPATMAQHRETSVNDTNSIDPLAMLEQQFAKAQVASQAGPSSQAGLSSQAGPSSQIQQQPAQAANGVDVAQPSSNSADESVYHLPPGLQDLVPHLEAIKNRDIAPDSAEAARLHAISHANAPQNIDAEKPRPFRPLTQFNTPSYYPQETAPIFDDPRVYSRLDTDTLFFIFYYRQGTYQQYLAAKTLKAQSWRFHKQYQTWFQRHEEPKIITEEYEQGTYRFFDYESTWMNRRKPDFKFAYKYLEDDL
ncbi:MAG: general negative regulator of transcription subunit 5 [Vezdaea aestivalis]|nr:MAG: general negative regulator of transcription subunit 5 [Vezdaea aestivalis]